jgi:hypothetical protein
LAIRDSFLSMRYKILINRRNPFQLMRLLHLIDRKESLPIDGKEILPADEVVIPHQTEEIPSGQ